MPKLTKRVVDDLRSSSGKPAFAWDSSLSGFGVKALPSGSKRYLVKYRVGGGGRAATQRWVMLGTHGQLTCEQARTLAQQLLAGIARGEDPQERKDAQRRAPRLTDVWERFEAEKLHRRKDQTRAEYRRQWRDILEPALGSAFVAEITRPDVDALHKKLHVTPYQANRVLALLSRLMNQCEAWGWRGQGSNPCRFIEKFPEVARSRYLSADELAAVGAQLDIIAREGRVQATASRAIMLLLLTGARSGEILSAQWDWVDWARCLIMLPDSKTGAKPLFLSGAAITVLQQQKASLAGFDTPYIIPGRDVTKPLVNIRKIWSRVCAGAGVAEARVHDLRHTAASIAVGQGASLPIIGRLLGHSQAQTTMRYAHVDHAPALAVANAIGAVISGAWRTTKLAE